MTEKPLVVVAGSYEGGLYGWSVDRRTDETLLGAAELTWAFGAHMGAVKSVAVDAAGEWLATGGVDEYIKLYTLSNRRERGELTQHTGSVTALAFYKSSHLLSASQDGTVCIWNTANWHCEHVLGGHKDSVTCLSIHPSGRMALSGSKDRTLRLWNLVEVNRLLTKKNLALNNRKALQQLQNHSSDYLNRESNNRFIGFTTAPFRFTSSSVLVHQFLFFFLSVGFKRAVARSLPSRLCRKE